MVGEKRRMGWTIRRGGVCRRLGAGMAWFTLGRVFIVAAVGYTAAVLQPLPGSVPLNVGFALILSGLVLAFEGERRSGLEAAPSRARRLLALSGPEGGFTDDEVAAAAAAGAFVVGLGPRLLRAETAAVVLAALAQHRWGDG